MRRPRRADSPRKSLTIPLDGEGNLDTGKLSPAQRGKLRRALGRDGVAPAAPAPGAEPEVKTGSENVPPSTSSSSPPARGTVPPLLAVAVFGLLNLAARSVVQLIPWTRVPDADVDRLALTKEQIEELYPDVKKLLDDKLGHLFAAGSAMADMNGDLALNVLGGYYTNWHAIDRSATKKPAADVRDYPRPVPTAGNPPPSSTNVSAPAPAAVAALDPLDELEDLAADLS